VTTPATAVRSRDVESEATRRAILDAAEAVLATAGEEGLSIREVCARAGVTPPTIYHHFGDKAGLIERVVDDRFADFDRAFAARTPPADPVEALRWGFDRYVEYGVRHPTHYRLLFETRRSRPSAGGLASYDRLRRNVAAIDAVGRLGAPVEDATAAFWLTMHGVTSLAVNGLLTPDGPAVILARDAVIAQLTTPKPAPRPRTRRARIPQPHAAQARPGRPGKGRRRPPREESR
jgi:AcrR family transcriptional regulator